MLDLGFLLLLLIGSAGVGRWVVRRFGPLPEHPTDALALAIPMGLGLLALAALGLGQVGLLGWPGLLGVFALGGLCVGWHALVFVGMFRAQRCLKAPDMLLKFSHTHEDEGKPPNTKKYHLVDLTFDAALAATLLGTLLTALAPVTDGDALCYHLQVPKLFLWAGSTYYEPDLHETVYPLVTEMLYAVALAFRGPIACRLVQWGFGLGFALSVTAIARPVLGNRARWAGTIALLVPAVSNGMGAPLNDVSLAAFGMAGLLAWTRWLDRPTLGTAAFTGVLMGLAIGVKYPALIWTGLLGGVMLAWVLVQNAEHRLRGLQQLAVYSLVALLVGGAWYLRAYLSTGNPVHPFFRHTFGGSGMDEVLDPFWRPLPVTPWHLLTAIGPMTLAPERFDSFSHQFGPAFLLFLPALFLWKPSRRLALIVALGYAFLTLCLTQRQGMRFVLIAVGPLSIGVAWLAATWQERRTWANRLLIGAVVLMLAFETTIAIGRARHGLGVVLGRETEAEFLWRREPTYRVGQWMESTLPATARIIGQDHRGFYLPRPYSMELAHRRRTGLGTHQESAEEIVEHFRREGFTHLLLCPPEPETAIEFDPTLSQRLAPWLTEQSPLYTESITDYDGVTRHYAIYELGDMTELARAPEERVRR